MHTLFVVVLAEVLTEEQGACAHLCLALWLQVLLPFWAGKPRRPPSSLSPFEVVPPPSPGLTCLFALQELEFAAACLQHDAKNYHAWAHRQAVLAALGTSALWGAELAFTERLLRQDVRNNSGRCVAV